MILISSVACLQVVAQTNREVHVVQSWVRRDHIRVREVKIANTGSQIPKLSQLDLDSDILLQSEVLIA